MLSNNQNATLNPQILIIDATLPTYDQDAGSLRLFKLIKMLVKLDYKIAFFPDIQHAHSKYQQALEALGVKVFCDGNSINEILTSQKFTFAWICRVLVAHRYIPFLRLLSPNTKIVYDTGENPSLAEQALSTKRQELSNCLLADSVITVTENDGNHLQKEVPQLTFSVIPNIEQHSDESTILEKLRDLLNSYNHNPTVPPVPIFSNAKEKWATAALKWQEISSPKVKTLKYAQIEMTTTCNQRCYFCPVSVTKRPKTKLSLEKLDKIITGLRAYPIETISIAGFSEPTYDKQILDKVRTIRKAGFSVLFYTNGSGLKPTLTDELLKAGIHRFTINLSTLDETQYEQTRGSKDLKQVIPNIEYLLAQVQAQTRKTEIRLIILGALDRQHGTNIQMITKRFAYSQLLQFSISPLGDYASETTPHVLPKRFYHKTLRGCARAYQNQWMHFTAAGEAILCCQDYSAKYKIGHIDDANASVPRIYQGEQITQWRRWISGLEKAPENFICRYCLFALSDDNYAQRVQKLFCQSCVLPNMLGVENACQWCEVKCQILEQ